MDSRHLSYRCMPGGKIALEKAVIRLTHKKYHAQDCSDYNQTTNKIDTIEREIELWGELDEKHKTEAL